MSPVRRLPPLGALRAFEAAARHLSFKEAADELGLTPTAISHQVRLLEDYCGEKLFRRRPRPLALSVAGARLFPPIREGFDVFASALSSLRTEADAKPLRVTTTGAFASRWLVPRLSLWREAHAHIALSIIGVDRVVQLETDEADLAIRYARSRCRAGRPVRFSATSSFPSAAQSCWPSGLSFNAPPIFARIHLSILTGSPKIKRRPTGSDGLRWHRRPIREHAKGARSRLASERSCTPSKRSSPARALHYAVTLWLPMTYLPAPSSKRLISRYPVTGIIQSTRLIIRTTPSSNSLSNGFPRRQDTQLSRVRRPPTSLRGKARTCNPKAKERSNRSMSAIGPLASLRCAEQ
jgi:DNA-binding transcriptional LysR family regulator